MARGRFHGATIPRPAKKIQSTLWELSTGSSLALAAGSAAIGFSSVGSAPTTLLRMRGEVLVFKNAVSAPGVLASVAMGIILVPVGSGTTVQFSPVTDANAPWIWYETAHIGYEEMVADVIDVPTVSGKRITVDGKAMRKIRPEVEMQFVVENTTIGTALSINMVYSIRWLQGF